MDHPVERAEWLFASPAMVVLVVDQIYFSKTAEDAFRAMGKNPKAVQQFFDFVVAQIDYMVGMVRGELTSLQRTLMGAILTIDVHGREVVKDLISKNVSNANEFGWNRQLRYYWRVFCVHCGVRGAGCFSAGCVFVVCVFAGFVLC